jgi:2'-5' RNA ligase
MKKTIRTFIAIKIIPDKKLFDLISNLKKSLAGEEIRWVENDNLHLTLRFLGETNQFQIDEISKKLETISGKFQPFQFELKGLSVFKKKIQPHVLFVSVDNDFVLKQLATEIKEMCKIFGFTAEENTFNPHLTLGRIKHIQNKVDFYALVKKYNETKFQQVIVSEIIFYQSILGIEGPTYKPTKLANLN